MPKLVRELDDACALVARRRDGGRGAASGSSASTATCDVRRPVFLNRALRQAGLLTVRPGPFGEMLDTFESRAFAVCDHQLAHVYVRDAARLCRGSATRSPSCRAWPVSWPARSARSFGLHHPRAGELVALAEPDAWFAYPFWLDDSTARRTTPARSTSIASRATTRASCSSIRSSGGRRAGPSGAGAEEARLPDAVRRDPARCRPGPRQSRTHRRDPRRWPAADRRWSAATPRVSTCP